MTAAPVAVAGHPQPVDQRVTAHPATPEDPMTDTDLTKTPAYVIGRLADASQHHGDRMLELWDDDARRTRSAALIERDELVDDSDVSQWRVLELRDVTDEESASREARVWLPGDTVPAAARIVAALADAIDAHDNWIPADHANVRAVAEDFADGDPDDEPIAAALLDAARRENRPVPRVWLAGDTVPAGVRVIADCGGPWVNTQEAVTDIPLIEVVVPRRAAFAAAVAAEQARRAVTDCEVGE